MRRYLVVFLILFAFLLTYMIHLNDPGKVRVYGSQEQIISNPGFYPYPIHGDEWNHVAITMHLIETESFPNINPYTNTKRVNLQSGVHLFLGVLFLSSGLNIIYFYQFLAPLFAILTSLMIYILIKEYTKNEYSGFFAAIFFLSIKSNINVIGNLFFVPHTFSFFLLICFLYFYLKKDNFLLGATFFISLISYPMLSILLAGIYLLNELLNKRFNYYVLIFPSFLVLSALIYFKGDFNVIFYSILFKVGWTGLNEYIYGVFELLSFVVFIFAIIGIYKLWKQKKYLFLLTLLPTFSIMTYLLFDFSVLIPYQRSLIYTFIGLSLIAGIEFGSIFKKLVDIKSIFGILVALLLVSFSFLNYYSVDDDRFIRMHIATENSVSGFDYLQKTYGSGNLIITDHMLSFISYPLSKSNLLAFPNSNLIYGDMSIVRNFFLNDCIYKNDFLKDNDVDFILTFKQLSCDYDVKKIGDFYIYKLK